MVLRCSSRRIGCCVICGRPRLGLSSREAARRLVQFGPNELSRRGGVQWPRELARQLTHPLALLLWVAALLSFAVGSMTVGIAVVLVIVLNAAFAFVQELQAERAVEALAAYMPQQVTVLRDGTPEGDRGGRVSFPGDIVLLEEGERIAADMRLLSGAVEVDLSTLTGESVPAMRSAELHDATSRAWQARDLVFSGTMCTGGEARASCSRPACTPSWAGSRRCRSASRRSPARSSGRSAGWRG